MGNTNAAPVFELQEADFVTDEWQTIATYDTANDNRAQGNAYQSYSIRSGSRPHRLLKDGKTVLGYDDPKDFYNNDDWD